MAFLELLHYVIFIHMLLPSHPNSDLKNCLMVLTMPSISVVCCIGDDVVVLMIVVDVDGGVVVVFAIVVDGDGVENTR